VNFAQMTDEGCDSQPKCPALRPKNLEVVVGHHRAVICGIRSDWNQTQGDGRPGKRIMWIVELPFIVDPAAVHASVKEGTLTITLPGSQTALGGDRVANG
jgi:HSP20 family molecular chaperone IbpA